MALILMLLGTKGIDDRRLEGKTRRGAVCQNPHCITRTERGIKKLFDEYGKCVYCDQYIN